MLIKHLVKPYEFNLLQAGVNQQHFNLLKNFTIKNHGVFKFS